MQKKITLKAYAKINLGLRVLGQRKDGFHEIETVMQKVSLADTVVMEPALSGKNSFYCSTPALSGEDNLAFRAARLLKSEVSGPLPPVKISLYKNIPVAAGLGGGSSDAACVLKGLNIFWRLGLKTEDLLQLAARLGSDVPFCLQGETVLAQGRGEKLLALPALPFFWISLILPVGSQVSTAESYSSFNRALLGKPSLEPLLTAVKSQNKNDILKWMENDYVNTLETAPLAGLQKAKELKNKYRSTGLFLQLSGSGPALFFLSSSFKTAVMVTGMAKDLGAKAYLCWTVK